MTKSNPDYMAVTPQMLSEGQTVYVDSGFPCVDAGPVVIKKDEHGLYFDCECDRHHLDVQVNEDGKLSGISLTQDPTVVGRDPYFLLEENEDEN